MGWAEAGSRVANPAVKRHTDHGYICVGHVFDAGKSGEVAMPAYRGEILASDGPIGVFMGAFLEGIGGRVICVPVVAGSARLGRKLQRDSTHGRPIRRLEGDGQQGDERRIEADRREIRKVLADHAVGVCDEVVHGKALAWMV